jgi:hypothetical protein
VHHQSSLFFMARASNSTGVRAGLSCSRRSDALDVESRRQPPRTPEAAKVYMYHVPCDTLHVHHLVYGGFTVDLNRRVRGAAELGS